MNEGSLNEGSLNESSRRSFIMLAQTASFLYSRSVSRKKRNSPLGAGTGWRTFRTQRYSKVLNGVRALWGEEEEEEEDEEFFNRYKNDLKRHAHTPSPGVAGGGGGGG